MTAPIRFPKGRFSRMNPAKQRQDATERLAEQYKQGAAQSDIEGDVPEESVNVNKDYDMLQRIRRKRPTTFGAPK